MQPDLRAVIDRGRAAKATLENEQIVLLINEFTAHHAAAIAACRPSHPDDEGALRYHHAMSHAFLEVISQLQGWVDAGAHAEAVLETQPGDIS